MTVVYDNCVFQNPGQYTIILGMKNGFVMIKELKNCGQYIKEKGENKYERKKRILENN